MGPSHDPKDPEGKGGKEDSCVSAPTHWLENTGKKITCLMLTVALLGGHIRWEDRPGMQRGGQRCICPKAGGALEAAIGRPLLSLAWVRADRHQGLCR